MAQPLDRTPEGRLRPLVAPNHNKQSTLWGFLKRPEPAGQITVSNNQLNRVTAEAREAVARNPSTTSAKMSSKSFIKRAVNFLQTLGYLVDG